MAEDNRVNWILDYIHKVFPDIPEQLINIYNRDNRQQLQKYLDDKVVFKSLFFQNIYNEEQDLYRKRALKAKQAKEARRARRARREARRARMGSRGSLGSKSSRASGDKGGRKSNTSNASKDDDKSENGEKKSDDETGEDGELDDDDLSDEDDDKSSGESSDEDIYTGPPPPILKMYVDKITESIHPFDIKFVYFTRLDRGPVPEPPKSKDVDTFLSNYMLKGLMDQDPIQMLHSFLKSSRTVMRSVRVVGTPEAGFEDKYIKKFYKLVESYAGKVEGELDIKLPTDLRPLYQVPFSPSKAAADPDAVKILNDCCYEWIQSVEKVINDLQKAHGKKEDKKQARTDLMGLKESETVVEKGPKDGVVENAVLEEIVAWENKLSRCERLEEQLKMRIVNRAMAILNSVGNVHAKTMTTYIQQVHMLLEEAQDNVKFLGTIRKPTHVLVTSTDFKEMRMTLPNLMNSLRNIWMLSKHYNTDEQICGLLDKITNIILSRVRGFMKFELLHEPSKAQMIALECRNLLTGWHESFIKTRQAIEDSARETRWEFSVQKQFNHVQHAADVCSDIGIVSDIISQLHFCFTDQLIESTKNPATIIGARERTNNDIESFVKLQYDPFDPSNAHHWKNHIAWFKREVRFIDAESATIAEEVYEQIQSSKLAIDALHDMMKTNYRKDIGKRLIAKVGNIINKFKQEIDEAEQMFLNQKENPPLKENLPPISGAIYWSNDIEKELNLSLTSLSTMEDVTSHKTWPASLDHYKAFQSQLHNYKMGRYDEWRSKVSDILSENLTRTLMLPLPPAENSKIERYLVNFTTDLSDTLAEVKHLEHLGFTVPEVARNMSLQEGKLTGIAADLRQMLNRYHQSVDSLDPAEEELMVPELTITQKSLRPGHSRLTWNSMGIKEYIDEGNQQISALTSKIRQVEILRVQLQECIDFVAQTKLLNLDPLKTKQVNLPGFEQFFTLAYRHQDRMFEKLTSRVSTITPLLLKVEEILVFTRTRRSPRLSSYYHHWEMKLFNAIATLITNNLDIYSQFLRTRASRFTIKALLHLNEVILEPDAATIMNGTIRVIRNMLDGTKKFVRFYRGSCIPVKPMYIHGQLEQVVPSFYDEIIILPAVVSKVEAIQASLMDILKMIFNYLSEWKSYRTVWKYDKQMTCAGFLLGSPTCVDFDEKLLFYYNLHRTIESAVNNKDFRCMRLQLDTLKGGILFHIQEWIKTLGRLLEQTAWERLDKITNLVDDYSSRAKPIRHSSEIEKALTLISSIWGMSLEVEIDYMDIQERCRTLDMYGIKSEKSIVSLSKDLPKNWDALFIKSKEIYHQLTGLKYKHSQIVTQKVGRLSKKLNELRQSFTTQGPMSENMSLEEGLNSLTKFRTALNLIDEQSLELNEYQRVFKMPLTNFHVLTILKDEFKNLEKIYCIFSELQTTMQTIETLTSDIYFLTPQKYGLDSIAEQIKELKDQFGDHTVLLKLEGRMNHFIQYLSLILRLKDDKIRQRHWEVLLKKSSIETDDKYTKFAINLFARMNQSFLDYLISSCVDLAQEEHTIEAQLSVIKKRWEDRKFVLTREKIGTSTHKLTIINQISSLHEEVERDDITIDTMLNSSKSEFFRPNLEKMKSVLAKITLILKTWISTQENCLVLARVLLVSTSGDYHDVQDLSENYEEDFKSYNKLMEEVAKKPIVSKSCLMPDRHDTLEEYRNKFIQHRMFCKKLLQLKQKSLPRLAFLTDKEALILLGGMRGEQKVFQQVVKKMFGKGVNNIHFEMTQEEPTEGGEQEEFLSVSHIETTNGEQLPIYRLVDCRQTTDVWLRKLIDEMTISVKHTLRKTLRAEISFADYDVEHFIEPVEIVALAVFETIWTELMQNTLSSDQPLNKIKDLYRALSAKIESVCENYLQEETDEKIIEKAKHLLNIFISKRNQLYEFLKINLHHTEDFGWKSTFQLTWRRDINTVEARQGLAFQKFGYEYQSVDSVPVDSDISDRVRYAMFSALHSYKPIYLQGGVFNGKTTAIVQLSIRLGRLLLFLQLNASFGPDELLSTLQGLCRANCWGHMDGTDLLNYHTLSILTSQLQQINMAQSMNLKEFHLGGHKTELGMETGFFFVSRQGGKHGNWKANGHETTMPPMSLASMYRQVYVREPEMLAMFYSDMMARGFEKPRSLSLNMIAVVEMFYKVASSSLQALPRLSLKKEIFHHFQMDTKLDSFNVSRALQLTFRKIMLKESCDILFPFIFEHFPQVQVSKMDMIEKSEGLQVQSSNKPHPIVGQITTILQRGDWPLLIGPIGVGKTSAVQSSAKELKKLGHDYEICEVSLSSFSSNELFGWEENGKRYTGILSNYLDQTSKSMLIILQAPLSENVAQNLASIYDSTEKQPIPHRIVLEAFNYDMVPPILLARCSIISISKEDEKGLSKLFPKQWKTTGKWNSNVEKTFVALKEATSELSIIPNEDTEQRRMNRQTLTLFKLMVGNLDAKTIDDTIATNSLVSSFCWSFGGPLQGLEQAKQFEGAIRSVISQKDDPLFEQVNPLENESFFQQRYNPIDKSWVKMESAIDGLMYILNLFVENDQPVMITGGRESSLLCKAYMNNVSKFSSQLIYPGNEMSTQDCITDITKNMSKKGENVLVPNDGLKTLPIIIGLENRSVRLSSSLPTTLGDIAKHSFFYSAKDGYRKIKLQNFALICQYDTTKNLRTLNSFVSIQYFNVLSLKDNSPLAVLQTHGWISKMFSNEMISKTHELYISFEKKIPQIAEKSPISILQLAGIDSFSTCLGNIGEKFNGKAKEEAEKYWMEALNEHFVVPLWTTLSINVVGSIFSDAGIDISPFSNAAFTHQDSESQPHAFAKTVHMLNNTLRKGNRLIVVVGLRGVGKSSAIAEACKNQDVMLHPTLVDPFEFKWSDYENVIGNETEEDKKLAFTITAPHLDEFSETDDSLENYSNIVKGCLKQTDRAIFFVRLSVNDFPPSFIKKLLSYIRGHSSVVGIPDWSANDLKGCHNPNEMAIKVDPLLNIHLAIEKFCKTINCKFFPSPSMLKLAYQSTDLRIKQNTDILETRRVLLAGVLDRLKKWDEMIELWTEQLEKVTNEKLSAEDSYKMSATNVEETKLNQETTSEQKAALFLQIPEFQRQVEVRQNDLQASNEKRQATLLKSAEVLRTGISEEDIETFCNRATVPLEVELICNSILIIAEGPRHHEGHISIFNHFKTCFIMPDWREQFLAIDAEGHGRMTSFFIERKMKELRKIGFKRSQFSVDEPIADALLEYCEGFIEVINTVEERIELESRLKVYEEMLTNMSVEVNRLQETEDQLCSKVEALQNEMKETEKKISEFEAEVTERKAKLTIAEKIKSSLQQQQKDWMDQVSVLNSELEHLEERETVSASAGIYLSELQQSHRGPGLRVIQNAIQSTADFRALEKIFDPSNMDNILAGWDLPGWKQTLCKRICVVYDPHNISLEIFKTATHTQVSTHYIESIKDFDTLKETIETNKKRKETLFLNFGGGQNLINRLISLLNQSELYQSAIFIITSKWMHAPTGTSFINMSIDGKELRDLACHMFSTSDEMYMKAKEEQQSLLKKQDTINLLESDLIEILTKNDIILLHEKICELAENLDNLRDGRETSLTKHATYRKSMTQDTSSEVLFPVAIITACCDMSYVLSRPCYSLTEFVHFASTKLQEGENSQTSTGNAQANIIIFQKHCLAYANKDQLLFQVLIVLHLKVLREELTDDQVSDLKKVLFGNLYKTMSSRSNPELMEKVEKTCPIWCRKEDWRRLDVLTDLAVDNVILELNTNRSAWKEWYISAESIVFPGATFQSFLLATVLLPDKLAKHLKDFFMLQDLDDRRMMVMPDTVCLDYIHSFSISTSPIFLYIDENSEEPTFHLKKLADVLGIAATKVKYLALGSGNGKVALDLLDTAFVRGQWLIFQNLQLVPEIIVALQRRIDEANDIHEDFRLWFTWEKEKLPHLQLLQKSITIYCQAIRAIQYHTKLFVYSLDETMFKEDSLKCNIISAMVYLHRKWESREEYAKFYWQSPLKLPSTQILNELSQYAHLFSWTRGKDVYPKGQPIPRGKKVRGEELRNRLRNFLCFLYAQFIHNDQDLGAIENEVDDVLLTLVVDEIVRIKGTSSQLKRFLASTLLSPIQAPGKIFPALRLSCSSDTIFMKTTSKNLVHNISQLYKKLAACENDDEEKGENSVDLSGIFYKKIQNLESSLEKFESTKQQSHPETGTNEEMEFNLLQGEKVKFMDESKMLLREIMEELRSDRFREWKNSIKIFELHEIQTPQEWIHRSGVYNFNLDSWLNAFQSKIEKFLANVEPINLSWLFDPRRYLSSVTIRHIASSNLSSTDCVILITLSGINDISELKEGLHVGCYATGIHLFGATWTDNEEGPVERRSLEGKSSDVVQNLGIVSLLPIEREKVQMSNYFDVPLLRHIPGTTCSNNTDTYIDTFKVKVARTPRLTAGIRFLLCGDI